MRWSATRASVPQAFIRRATRVFIIISETASVTFVIPPLSRSMAMLATHPCPCLGSVPPGSAANTAVLAPAQEGWSPGSSTSDRCPHPTPRGWELALQALPALLHLEVLVLKESLS